MTDSRKIAMTSTSAHLAFTGTLIEEANNALWQKATLYREKFCRYRWSYYWMFL